MPSNPNTAKPAGPVAPAAPSMPSQANGSFGYMQNPMMSGAGMPRALPMQARGTPMKPAPMYEPKALKAQAAQPRPMKVK